MVIFFSKFQFPSFYGFEMDKKWHVRGISIDNSHQQYFFLLGGRHDTKGVKGDQKKSRKSVSASYIPLAKFNYLVSFEVFYHQ